MSDGTSLFPQWFWWGFAGLFVLNIALMGLNYRLRRIVDKQMAE